MTSLLKPLPPRVDPNDVRLQEPDAWEPVSSTKSRAIVTALAIASTLAAVWYLGWLLNPARVGNPYLYSLLIAAEVFNVLSAFGFWWTLTRSGKKVEARKRADFPPHTEVDVFIPTYSESVDVVEATVAAAVEIDRYVANVWILDDGNRPEMEDLADRYGAGYITREEHKGAKAGNINHAMGVTDAPFIAILDCDHVPRPDFLEATLPDFADEKVAFVQTPQYYANHTESPIAEASWSQQAIFFGAIGQGKATHDSMFCCGTNVVFRREALDTVGGFPTNSITEDYELSVHLHEDGWKSTYVSKTLASGLGPEDMASYVSQQQRWARGVLSAMPRVFRSKLSFRQRVQYLLAATYFLSGFTVLIYMSMPLLSNFFGIQPIAQTTSDQFLLHFAPYYALCLYTLMRAGAGSFSFKAFALASASFWIHIHAAVQWLFRRPSKFVVTPKEGSAARQPKVVAPGLVVIAALVTSCVYALSNGVTPATLNNVGFAILHVSVLAAGLWPALVKGQGKVQREQVLDIGDHPHLSLVRSDSVNA